jgi:hypothetical protein
LVPDRELQAGELADLTGKSQAPRSQLDDFWINTCGLPQGDRRRSVMVRLAEHRIVLNTRAAEAFRHLTTVEGLLRWIAVDAIAEPEPGGRLQWMHDYGATMSAGSSSSTRPGVW